MTYKKISYVKCIVENDDGEYEKSYISFDEFLLHVIKGKSDSGWWTETKYNKLVEKTGIDPINNDERIY